MTDQEAFTCVVKGLRKQGEKSIDHNTGKCLYRHSDGIKRCAVGMLIPDSEYSQSMENLAVVEVQKLVPSLKGLSERLLQALQSAHDGPAETMRIPWTIWMERWYIKIARDFRLTLPAMED